MNPERVAHYELVRKLGEGGMGEVFLARDTRLERQVALKFLPADLAADAQRRHRFMTEAKAASALNHPNVCIIHEVGESQDGRPFIAMEFIEGQTLSDRIRQGNLALADAIEIAAQIADALDAAHTRGIVHRDIKPANVSLTSRGQAKVLDFGLAKRMSEPERNADATQRMSKTQSGQVLGTPSYMSPEQARGRDIDPRTDLFSFGVVLYEMITGRSPFVGNNFADTIDRILNHQPEPLARFNDRSPPELERIVRKCLEKLPDRRFQTARDLLIDLRNLLRPAAQSGGAPGFADGATMLETGFGVAAPSSDRAALKSAANRPSPDFESLKSSDVFITCASVDDEPLSQDQQGWITQLQKHLQVRLTQLSGEPIVVNAVPVSAQHSLDPGRFAPVLNAAKAMISVVSPPFVKSEDCRRLVEGFWQAAELSGGLWVENRPRLLPVVKTPVLPREMPPGLAALLGQVRAFEFFDRDPDTGLIHEFDARFGPDSRQHYFERVYDLAQEINGLFTSLRHGSTPELQKSAGPTGKVVFLASCTSDVQSAADRIRRELVAQGHTVLPERPLPLLGSELEKTVSECLTRSSLSIHLIGGAYGLIPEESDVSMVQLQNTLAAARAANGGLRRIVWFAKDLKPRDARQEQFIRSLKTDPAAHCGADLLQDTIEALKVAILDRLTPKPASPATEAGTHARQGPLRVYLICDREDQAAIQPLEDFLFDQGLEVSLPDFEASEAEASETHRMNLLECDAALVYFGAARHSWVDIKLRSLLKVSGYGRPDPIPVQAVYVAPPMDPRKERFRTHIADVIRQPAEFAPAALAGFVESIQERCKRA